MPNTIGVESDRRQPDFERHELNDSELRWRRGTETSRASGMATVRA